MSADVTHHTKEIQQTPVRRRWLHSLRGAKRGRIAPVQRLPGTDLADDVLLATVDRQPHEAPADTAD